MTGFENDANVTEVIQRNSETVKVICATVVFDRNHGIIPAMEITIFARVVAKPIAFPDDIEMQYICLDEQGRPTGITYGAVHFTWSEVIRRFWLDDQYAKECEGYFREGHSAFIGNKEVNIDVDQGRKAGK